MRELKARAWDIDNKRFVYAHIGQDEVWLDDGISTIEMPFHHSEWERPTGLKDKNGKEIYEGDIVRTKSPDRGNFTAGAIEMVQQMFLIMNSAHYSDPEISHCEPLGYYCDTELEIIGNIHENPGLIGEEEE